MQRRKVIKTIAASGISTSAAATAIGNAGADSNQSIITYQDIGSLNRFNGLDRTDTETGKESFDGDWWNNQNPREAAVTTTLGYYGSDFTNRGVWEHDMLLSGCAACVDLSDDDLRNQFNGIGFNAQFDQNDWENKKSSSDEWYIDFTQQKRGISEFSGGNTELSIPPTADLAADVVIPTVIGAFNVPAGAVAAGLLAVDDFANALEPTTGDQAIEYGGAKFFSKNSFYGGGQEYIAFSQLFEIVHSPTTAGIGFEVETNIFDRIAEYFGYDMEPSANHTGTVFSDDSIALGAGSGVTLQESDLPETTHPAKMTEEQRERYGIEKVDPSVQDLVAKRHDSGGDKVLWTIN